MTKLERRKLTYRDVVVKLVIKLANFRWVAEVKRRLGKLERRIAILYKWVAEVREKDNLGGGGGQVREEG